MVLLRISEEQLLFNPARPYGFSWKVNLVPKLILSVTMQTIIKLPLVTILHAIGGGGDGCMHSGSDARRQDP